MLMIEEMLKAIPNDQKNLTTNESSVKDLANENGNNKSKLIINVHDFSGNFLYLLINQVRMINFFEKKFPTN